MKVNMNLSISSTLKYITIILLLFSVINITAVNLGLGGMKGDGRIVNYSGIVRGATQRLIKLEMAGKNSDELITRLDGIVAGLMSGSEELDLKDVNDPGYIDSMVMVSGSWTELKQSIYDFRKDPALGSLLIEKSEKYFELTNSAVSQAENYSKGNVLRMQMLQGFLFLMNLAVLAGIVYVNRKKIALPLSIITKRTRDLTAGEGDLSKRIQLDSRDELGVLAGLFNTFVENIQDVIRVVKDISSNLAAASDQMSSTTLNFSESAQSNAATAEEVSASMEEMSASMDNIANGAEHQLEALREMIKEVERLSGIIIETGSSIDSTTVIMSDITSRVRKGEESLLSMNDTMQNIKKSSVEMGGVVSIINDISDQINLLSLNAAIESARAGEAGRGFAVVADEISKLADRTASSIRDIINLIKVNEKETENGITGIKDTVAMLGEIIKGVSDISGKFSQVSVKMKQQLDVNKIVNEKMNDVSDKSDQIAQATSEQKTAAGEVVHSIGIISDIAQTTATGAEELAATSEEIAGMAESLREKADFFKV
jgi:methyl-accepting chemotaxis protein